MQQAVRDVVRIAPRHRGAPARSGAAREIATAGLPPPRKSAAARSRRSGTAGRAAGSPRVVFLMRCSSAVRGASARRRWPSASPAAAAHEPGTDTGCSTLVAGAAAHGRWKTAPESEASDETVRWVASGTHPDLLTVERGFDEKRGRALLGDRRRRRPQDRRFPDVVAGDGRLARRRHRRGRRDEPQRRQRLLKVLEEPERLSLLIILVAHQPGLVPQPSARAVASFILRPLSDECSQRADGPVHA